MGYDKDLMKHASNAIITSCGGRSVPRLIEHNMNNRWQFPNKLKFSVFTVSSAVQKSSNYVIKFMPAAYFKKKMIFY